MVRPTISEIIRSTVMSALADALDHMAVAQHHDLVAQPHHVAEDVADVDDGDAAALAAGR